MAPRDKMLPSTEEILIPEVRELRGGRYRVTPRDWRFRQKGERVKYRWKKRPYVHQVEAVKKLLSTGFGGALLMEPRTGKTKVAVDYASILFTADRIRRVLIFCPLGVM